MNAGIEKMISNDNSGIKQLSSEIDRQIIFKSLLVMHNRYRQPCSTSLGKYSQC